MSKETIISKRPSLVRLKINTAINSIKSMLSGDAGGEGIAQQTSVLKELDRENSNGFVEAAKRVHSCADLTNLATSSSPYGYFQGRFIIGEKTRINGGIYIGIEPQEALVVDDKYGLLKRLFNKSCGRCVGIREDHKDYEIEIFREIVAVVCKTLELDAAQVAEIALKEKLEPDQKIALDVFVENGVGLSRHRILLAAYLFERLRDMGVIQGITSLERYIDSDGIEHELLFYITPDQQIHTFDPLVG